MCVYSMIADGWMRPPWNPYPFVPADPFPPYVPTDPWAPWRPKDTKPIPLPGLPKDPINDLLPLPKSPIMPVKPGPNTITLPTKSEETVVPNALPDIFKPSHIPLSKITPEIAAKMLTILELLDEVDTAVGAKDCLLNAAEKKQFVENLRKIAGKKCPCKKKKAKKKTAAKSELLQEDVLKYVGSSNTTCRFE